MPDPNEPQLRELPEELLQDEKPLVDRLQSLLMKGTEFIGRGDDRVELRDVIIALQGEPVLVTHKQGNSVEELTDRLEAMGGAADDEAAAALAEAAAREASRGGPDAPSPEPLPNPEKGLPDPERELPAPTPPFEGPVPGLGDGTCTGDAPPSGEGAGTADPPLTTDGKITVEVPEVSNAGD